MTFFLLSYRSLSLILWDRIERCSRLKWNLRVKLEMQSPETWPDYQVRFMFASITKYILILVRSEHRISLSNKEFLIIVLHVVSVQSNYPFQASICVYLQKVNTILIWSQLITFHTNHTFMDIYNKIKYNLFYTYISLTILSSILLRNFMIIYILIDIKFCAD